MTTFDRERDRAGKVVDPSAISDPESFSAALVQLRHRAGMTIREVSRATGIPSATLGGYFSGRHLPPPTQKAVLAKVLQALGVPAEEVESWRAALLRARRTPEQRSGGQVVPYRGLESYRVMDADWFIGRELLVAELTERVERLFDRPGPRLVTVIGASGVGKSSLLRAGLIARLGQGGVAATVLAPGGDPPQELTSALAGLAAEEPRRLVVVDQFEEVWSERVADRARQLFLESLTTLADEPGTVVVLAVRADFYGHAVAEPLLLPLLRDHQVLVGPLDRAALRRAVEEPAARAGCSVEPELVELALRDLTPRGGDPQASALPLLSHALLSVWSKAGGGRLTVSDYVAVGGVAGAVQRTAEDVYGSLDPAARTAARSLFRQLVSVDDEGMATRRRLRHQDLVDEGHCLRLVVERFVAGRILTATEQTIEISHEVLLTAWPRLREWLEEDRDALRVRRRIGQAAADWDRDGRDNDALLRGPLLEEARRSDTGPDSGLTSLERAFVAASVAHADRLERAERRRARRMRVLFAAVAVLAVVTSLLSAYLDRARTEADAERAAAEEATNRALSRQVAIQADHLAETEPSLAMQLSLVAHQLAPTVEARSSLLDVTDTGLASRLLGPEGPMRAVATPDGRVLATAGSDGEVRLWGRLAEGGAPVLLSTFSTAGKDELYAAAVSPDGRLLAVAGVAGVVTLLDVADPESPTQWGDPLTAPELAVQDVAFSPDGRTLMAATSDPALYRWRLRGGTAVQLPVATGFAGSVQGVAQSSQGLVATGDLSGRVRLWREVGDRLEEVATLPRQVTGVRAVAFSPDGALLAAGSVGKTVTVWDTGALRPVTEPLTGFASWVNAVAFSADGARLAAGASGGALQVWNTTGWEVTASLPGPANHTSVQFLPGDRQLLTGSLDGVARVIPLQGPRLGPFGDNIWGLAHPTSLDRLYVGVGRADPMVVVVDTSDPMAPEVVGEPLLGPAEAGPLDGTVGVSPDGSLVVAGTATGRLVVWRVTDRGEPRRATVLSPATGMIEQIAFSADGRHFAASAADGSVAVYQAVDRGLPRLVRRFSIDSLALGVAISPDSSLVAVGDADDRVHLWPLTTEGSADRTVLEGFENYVYALGFSPDGAVLAAGGADGTVRRWDVTEAGKPRLIGTPLRGPADTVFDLSFDPSGERLAVASQDGRVWVWSLADPEPTLLARLGALGAAVFQVAHHPNEEALIAAGAGGRVGTWLTDVGMVRELVCRKAGSPITAEEWAHYVPGAPYEPPCSTA